MMSLTNRREGNRRQAITIISLSPSISPISSSIPGLSLLPGWMKGMEKDGRVVYDFSCALHTSSFSFHVLRELTASHRLTLDLWLAKDNRFLNPKSSYERILTAPPCRLIHDYSSRNLDDMEAYRQTSSPFPSCSWIAFS